MARIKGAKEVDLSHMRERWNYRKLLLDQIQQLKDELAKVDAELKAAIGDNEVAVVDGRQVVDYRRQGQFLFKQFEQDNPHIVAAYSREVTKREFDLELFRANNPALYEQYRVRAFRPINPTKEG